MTASLYLKYLLFLPYIFINWSALARDITPSDRMGSLKFTIPNLTEDKEDWIVFEQSRVTFTANDGGSTILKADKEVLVTAGEGCLTVEAPSYKVQKCNFEIQPQHLTVIPLSILDLHWDRSLYVTDLGPKVSFWFAQKGNSTTVVDLQVDPQMNPNHHYLLPAMDLTLYMGSEETGVLHSQTFSVPEGAIYNAQVSRTDFRGRLLLDFVDPAPKFSVSPNNLIVASYRDAQLVPNESATENIFFTSSMAAGFQNVQLDHMLNANRIDLSGTDKFLYAFPVKTGKYYYYVTVNEHSFPVDLQSGEEVRVPIATLNINNYESNRPGYFLILSNRNDVNSYEEVSLPIYHPGISAVAYQLGCYFPTQSSVFLLFGFKYRFDFYATDQLNTRKLQNKIEVDLTHE